VFKRAYHYVRNIFIDDITINASNITIQNWFASQEIHSLHQITFATLFEKVVRIIIHHEHKEGLIERLREELMEAMGMCFTGRINRLVNSLSGIVEGIKVSFSIEEQIQLESQQIIKRLNDKTITLEKAKEEMEEIFNDEDIVADPQLMKLKEDYIIALEDFADDAEAIDF
jgi:regulator of replication initiation timing